MDEVVDLSKLGNSDEVFHPYHFERNELWIIAPIAMLVLVFLHLRSTKRKRKS